MKAVDYWQLIMETGAPEAYLLYNAAKRMESTYVPNSTGPGDPGHTIQ